MERNTRAELWQNINSYEEGTVEFRGSVISGGRGASCSVQKLPIIIFWTLVGLVLVKTIFDIVRAMVALAYGVFVVVCVLHTAGHIIRPESDQSAATFDEETSL